MNQPCGFFILVGLFRSFLPHYARSRLGPVIQIPSTYTRHRPVTGPSPRASERGRVPRGEAGRRGRPRPGRRSGEREHRGAAEVVRADTGCTLRLQRVLSHSCFFE